MQVRALRNRDPRLQVLSQHEMRSSAVLQPVRQGLYANPWRDFPEQPFFVGAQQRVRIYDCLGRIFGLMKTRSLSRWRSSGTAPPPVPRSSPRRFSVSVVGTDPRRAEPRGPSVAPAVRPPSQYPDDPSSREISWRESLFFARSARSHAHGRPTRRSSTSVDSTSTTTARKLRIVPVDRQWGQRICCGFAAFKNADPVARADRPLKIAAEVPAEPVRNLPASLKRRVPHHI